MNHKFDGNINCIYCGLRWHKIVMNLSKEELSKNNEIIDEDGTIITILNFLCKIHCMSVNEYIIKQIIE